MEVISLSIDDETLDKIEEISESASFKGRSELVRTAVENLYRSTMNRKEIEGKLNAVIVARHSHHDEQKIAEISHRFDEVITTQLHSKLSNQKCLEIFHTNGLAAKVRNFHDELQGSRHTESVKILPQN